MPKTVLPEPAPPQTNVGRPRGMPRPVSSSKPSMPVGALVIEGFFFGEDEARIQTPGPVTVKRFIRFGYQTMWSGRTLPGRSLAVGGIFRHPCKLQDGFDRARDRGDDSECGPEQQVGSKAVLTDL